jgi:hypothetical protein
LCHVRSYGVVRNLSFQSSGSFQFGPSVKPGKMYSGTSGTPAAGCNSQ